MTASPQVRALDLRILLPTFSQLERPDPSELHTCEVSNAQLRMRQQATRTYNERYHGGSISSGSFKALNQLLYLPDLDVLLCVVGLWSAHLR